MHLSISNSKIGPKLAVFALFQIVLIIIITFIWQYFPKSHRFEENQLNIIEDLQTKLQETQGFERILLLGGSSFGFSVSAKEIAKETGILTINLGTHAGLLFHNIWELYEEYTNPETDLIVISPEYELIGQLNGVSKEYCMVIFLQKNLIDLFFSPTCLPSVITNTITESISYLRKKSHPMSIYFRSAANDVGDIESHLGLDNLKIDYSLAWQVKPTKDEIATFINYVENKMVRNNYSVRYLPVLLPQSSCNGNIDFVSDIQNTLHYKIDKTSLLDLKLACYPDHLFFNTIYHMNREGRNIRTNHVIAALTKTTDD